MNLLERKKGQAVDLHLKVYLLITNTNTKQHNTIIYINY